MFLEVLKIVQEWESKNGFPIWPGDTLEKKQKFAEFCYNSGFLTLSTDTSGSLAGFLFFYRGKFTDGFNFKDLYGGGEFVVSDCLWIRPDLRKDGRTLKNLIKKALRENKEKINGGETLVFQRHKAGEYKERRYNFPRFWRKYNG